jgi:hypothetical protein
MTSNPTTPDAQRLTRRDRMWLIVLVVFGGLALALGLHLYPTVFPEATIKFDVDRKESRARAESFLREKGFEIAGYRYASAFQYDDSAKVFLEKELGLEAMDEAVAKTARIWKWSHRWFRPLQKEEFRVDIAPTGQLVAFEHLLKEDAGGGRLPEADARRLAEETLSGIREEGLSDLRYLGASAIDRESRTDRVFTWERTDVDWKGGRYRHRVTIQGEELGGYAEYVQVPEAWERDYSQLRSANYTAGAVSSVLMVATMLAMLIVLGVQLRRRTIRWRFALGFGLVAAILLLLTNLNNLPQSLFQYDTTRSYGGFLAERLLRALAGAALFAGVIIVMTAAGETQYRSAFPRKIAIPSFFTWPGLRSKEFLFSSLGGLVLTCFFLAYQTVFYRVASSLGAWSPAEVPYDNLLNSTFPWAFLLFVGFMPSVTEEFTSRVFSIPLFTKIFRSGWIGIILPAFIWGFGHSAYPNQPFYIRGLEVGLAGCLIGVLMLRFNILALLIWHYTVDALYSGYLLLRSGDPYYVTTTAVAGGIFVLPFLIALFAYVRSGRFTAPDPLRHMSQPLEMPGKEGVSGEQRQQAVPGGIGMAPAWPGAVLEPSRPGTSGSVPMPEGMSGRRALVALGVSVAVLAIFLGIGAGKKAPEAPMRVDRTSAVAHASEFVKGQGIDTGSMKRVAMLRDEAESDEARYVLSHLGFDRFRSFWPERMSAQTWSVRFFKPLEPEEARLRIDTVSGRVVAYDHRIAEADSLPTTAPEQAEALAVAILASVGLDAAGLDRKEAVDKPRPKRMDRIYAWEAPEGDARNVGEARYRLEAKVTGNRAAGLEEKLRLPEEYERLRSRHTVLWAVGFGLVLLGAGAILALTFRDAGRAHTDGRIPWRRLLWIGAAGAVLALCGTLNALPRLMGQYQTTTPWSSFMVVVIVGLITAMVFYFLVGWAGAAMIRGLHPQVAGLHDPRTRRGWLIGGVCGFVLFPVWAKILGQFRFLLAAWFPHSAAPPPIGASPILDTTVPALGVIVATVGGAFIFCLLLAAVTRLFGSRDWPGPIGRAALLAAVLLGMAILPARSTGEGLVNFARLAVTVMIAYGLILWVLRGNPLAYAAGAYGYFGVRAVSDLLQQPNGWARGHGIAAVLILLVPVVWILLSSRKGATSTEAGARVGA